MNTLANISNAERFTIRVPESRQPKFRVMNYDVVDGFSQTFRSFL